MMMMTLFALLTWLGVLAPVGVTLSVDPHVALPPADIRVRVHVLADSANAYVIVSCDGPSFYASSAVPLRADLSTLDPIWFRKLPAGEYAVLAALYRTQADGRIDEAGRAEARVIVVDPK